MVCLRNICINTLHKGDNGGGGDDDDDDDDDDDNYEDYDDDGGGDGGDDDDDDKEFMYRDITNVEHAIYDYTSNNRSHGRAIEGLKENLNLCLENIHYIHSKGSYDGNISHNTESNAVWSPPVQEEKCQEEKVCDKRQQ